MYQPIEQKFKKPAPHAVVYHQEPPVNDNNFYFNLLNDYGISLNPSQKQAVMTVEGPVLLVAGAGSGKTTVLTSRIGYMIQSCGIDPTKILLVTFTKKASVEMIERLARIPGMNRNASRLVVAGTYHSICLRILRGEGYNFQVLSSERRQHIMLKNILNKMDLHEAYSAETVAAVISYWKNSMIRPQDVKEKSQIEIELKEVYRQYEQMKEDQNLFDFDDMTLETYYCLSFDEGIRRKYQEQFEYIMCDEFQDTSFVQYEIIRLLAKPHDNLCVVGDDAQTVFSFRGASWKYMVNFKQMYPDCTSIVMDINYRSVPSIVGIGNAIIHHNPKQIKKTLKSVKSEPIAVNFATPLASEQEADEIIMDIKEKMNMGIPLFEISVIYRTHATGRAIFDKLLMADIPFVTYGKSNESFYQNTFIRPVMALLRVTVNSQDTKAIEEAGPLFYISKAEMRSTIDEITVSQDDEPSNLFERVLKRIADRKTGFVQRNLITKIAGLKKLKNMTTCAAIKEIRSGNSFNYESQLELDGRKTISTHKEMMLEILDEFEQASRGFTSIQSFLTFVERVEEKNAEMEELRRQPDIQAVRLMTIHASKGLEFDVVYAIGWSEGILPHAASLDKEKKEDSPLPPEEAIAEERRLAYVCVTRAKRYLYISSPQNHRNKKVETSRFVLESMGLESQSTEKRGVTV